MIKDRKRRGSTASLTSIRERDVILVAVGHDDLAPDKRVARIRGLLKGLPGPLGNGEMLVWVNPGDAESVPQDVFTLVEGVDDRLERWGPGGSAASVPANPADLMTKLSKVEQPAAVDVLGWLLSTTMAYGGPGRYGERKARDVVNTLVGLLGHSTRWWVNTETVGTKGALGWNPVTRCTFDAVVAGAGGGVLVTVLAVDED